jgi:hypothetical protein
MIDYLIEIIFKNIAADKIGSLLKDLNSKGKRIVNYNLTCNCHEVNLDIERSIEKIFCENRNFGLFLNLKELEKEGVCLQNCGIAVYKHENVINLEINFQMLDLKNFQKNLLTKNLMKLAKSIAIQYQIDDYFCGIEPAQEAQMRLFTKEQLGPFIID